METTKSFNPSAASPLPRVWPVTFITLGLLTFAGTAALQAASGNDLWNGGQGDNNWNSATNWAASSINRPPVGSDSLTFGVRGAGGLTLTNNITAATSFAGVTFNAVAPSFVLNGNSINATAGFTDNSPNLQTVNFPVAFSTSHSMSVAAGGSLTVNSVISGTGAYTLNKTGGGLLTLTGAAAGTNSYGPTTVSAGTLLLDYTQGGSTPSANIVPADALTLGGGTLQIIGSSSLASTQTFASTALSAGNSTITAAPVSGSFIPTVALKAFTTPAGSTLVLNGPAYSTAPTTSSGQTGAAGSGSTVGLQAATATITTTSAEANTVLQSTTTGSGDYYSFATVGMYDFAAISGSSPYTIVGYSQISGGTGNDGGYYLASTALDVNNVEDQNHYDDLAGSFTASATTTGIGGYRYNFNGAITTTIPAGTTYTTGGILVTPNVGTNNTTMTTNTGNCYFEPGFRSTSNAGHLAIYQNNIGGFLNLNINLVDGKTAGGTWSQNGPGTVVLGAVNTNTGAWYLNGGVTEIFADTSLGYPLTGATVNLNGGTICGAATFTLDNSGANKRGVALGNNGGGLAALTGNTMTVDGVVSGSGILVAGIPASATNGYTVGQVPGTGTGLANAQQLANGTVVLGGANTYSGNTYVDSGTLALGASGTIASTPQIVTAVGATFDVSAPASFTLGGSQSIAGSGTVNGSAGTSSGSGIYAGTDGGYGTNTFNNNLTFAAGALCYLDVGTVHNGTNDFISVGGALTFNGTTIHLKAPSATANLDTTADYVLMTAATISGSPASTPVWDVPPANYANFVLITNSTSVLLHYSASTPPSGSGTASPATLNRGQSSLITVTAVPGSNPIGSVVLNTTAIGGTSVTLVESNTSSLYTNTVTVGAGVSAGTALLTATITDTATPTPLTASVNISLTVLATQTWDGAGGNANWSNGTNWVSGVPPVTGDFVTFAGSTGTAPSMDSDSSLAGVTFASGVAAFTIGTPGYSLTLSAVGITNNSANAQTVNVPITLGTAETFNAYAGNLTLGQAITNGGNLISVDGSNVTTLAGAISGSGGLTMNGLGTNLITGNASQIGYVTVNLGKMQVNTGGVLGGSSLTVGTTSGSGSFVVSGGAVTNGALDLGSMSGSPSAGTVTVNSGSVVFTNVTVGGNNNGGVITINGGVVSLGAFNDKRDASVNGAASYNAGLVINSGAVSAGSIIISSGNSGGDMTVSNGSLAIGNSATTAGFEVGTGSSTSRGGFLTVAGGTLSYLGTDGLLINNSLSGAGNANFNGGVSTLTGITLNESGSTAGSAVLSIGGSAQIYLGTVGLVENSGSASATVNLTGGLLAAVTNWSTAVPLTLAGTKFQTADASGNPWTIALNGALGGTAGLNITGSGNLTLGGANTYTGNTILNGGTLALAAGASLASPNIFTAPGTTFDVSQTGGFTLNASQTLAGFCTVTGAVAAASSSTVYAGSNSVPGTLTFVNGLTESGGGNNTFVLSGNPAGTNNSFINASGGLSLSGANTITIIGSLASGGVYPLFNYGGSLSGDITDFSVSGAVGVLSNSVSSGIIYFINVTSYRSPTNVVWIGNASANNWDTETTTNWLDNGAGQPDYFVPGDAALFNNTGDVNATVNIPGTVSPGSVTINTTASYTFTGSGGIGGSGSLTVSNGSLTVSTANTYTGPTILDGGVLITAALANGSNPSGLGAATSDPGNLVFNGGTLAYQGSSAATDHGMTLTNAGGTMDVTGGTTLTVSGTLNGNGGLTLIDSGTLTLSAANNYSGGTTISNGVLNLANVNAAGYGTINLAGGTLQLSVGSQPTYTNALSVAGTSTLNSAGGNNNIFGGPISGGASAVLNMTISSSGTFSMNGSMAGYYGTIELGGTSGYFRFNAGGGNTQYGATNATIDFGSGSATLEARNPGTMALGALEGTSGTLIGPSATAGTLIWAIGSSTSNPTTTFGGTIEDHAGNENSAIVKLGTGTLTLTGTSPYTAGTTVSGGTLLVNGSISGAGAVTVQTGTALGGSGTIGGAVTIQSGGTLAPGKGLTTAGTRLTLNNALTLAAGSTNIMEVSHNSSTSDSIAGSGLITLGGTLTVVTNVGDAPFAAGDTFTLFSAGTTNYTGNFTATNLPALTTGLVWNWNPANGVLAVLSTTPPAFGNPIASGSDLVLSASGGAPGGPVSVLTSTNLLTPLSAWTTVTTGNFDGSGNFSYTVSGALSSGLPSQFYILKQ